LSVSARASSLHSFREFSRTWTCHISAYSARFVPFEPFARPTLYGFARSLHCAPGRGRLRRDIAGPGLRRASVPSLRAAARARFMSATVVVSRSRRFQRHVVAGSDRSRFLADADKRGAATMSHAATRRSGCGTRWANHRLRLRSQATRQRAASATWRFARTCPTSACDGEGAAFLLRRSRLGELAPSRAAIPLQSLYHHAVGEGRQVESVLQARVH